MKFRIEVMKRDISRGVRGDCNKCPIALAIRRALRVKSKTLIQAGSTTVDFFKTREADLLGQSRLPKITNSFIYEFDRGWATAKPFAFTLTVSKVVLAVIQRKPKV